MKDLRVRDKDGDFVCFDAPVGDDGDSLACVRASDGGMWLSGAGARRMIEWLREALGESEPEEAESEQPKNTKAYSPDDALRSAGNLLSQELARASLELARRAPSAIFQGEDQLRLTATSFHTDAVVGYLRGAGWDAELTGEARLPGRATITVKLPSFSQEVESG